MDLFNRIFKKTALSADLLSPGNPEIFSILGKGDTGIDCGANVGDVTALMAKNGAQIYAFEPNPFVFDVLKKRFENMPNVSCINKGAWVKRAEAPLYLHECHAEDKVKWSTGSSLLEFKGNVNKENFVQIETLDLSEFVKNLKKKVKILKIDVEGVEFDILIKLIDTGIIKKIKHIFVETHEKKIPELADKADLLQKKIRDNNIKNINLNWI